METLTPAAFVDRWRGTTLGERQSYQAHFMDVCRLVGYETPTGSGTDSKGNEYVFEKSLKKQEGGQGYADVYLEGHFAIEYKAPGKYNTLADAYNQLLQYREKLNNPYLLVVTDIQTWEIHTNFPNSEKQVYAFTHDDIGALSTVRDWLAHMFHQPERLHPSRNRDQVTRDAADAFKLITDNMRQWDAVPERIAHFMTKLVFCLFAEDVGLLPAGPSGQTGIFSEIIEKNATQPEHFIEATEHLFKAMADGGRIPFVNIDIPYFNGSLFDDVVVERLEYEALTKLKKAADLNWESVEPAIFGTLFERSLDPAKRSQLGAHYTSRDDILLIIEPVLMTPLEREWARIRAEAAPVREKYDDALTSGNRRQQTTYSGQLQKLRDEMLGRLTSVKVLDPACGSGNFLYVALQRLMTMEKDIITHELFAGLSQPFPQVHPRQMYGIEINPIAHALASIVVWIGYIQWRKNNGYLSWSEPILEPMAGNIVCKDAILAYDADGNPTEPDWPPVDVIIGNPPFLGGQKLLRELGAEYVTHIRSLYGDVLHSSADLVGYWFESARRNIVKNRANRAGLLATQSIRSVFNRPILEKIKETGDIFMAWADREWILDGAAVRVSMVGFDDGSETTKLLDGLEVKQINSTLSSRIDLTLAGTLAENLNLSFEGNKKSGSFDIDAATAQQLIADDEKNRKVVKIWINGQDVSNRPRNMWIIDFGALDSEEATQYAEPFNYVVNQVKPARLNSGEKRQREYWWQFARPRPNMREAIEGLSRIIVTVRVSKHHVFTFLDSAVVPDSRLYVFARDDDYFFGVLHSRIHEVWSLATSSRHGDGKDGGRPTYNNTTCFETFPFPFAPGTEDFADPRVSAISAAARQLHEERDAWLNPPGVTGGALKDRTLTNLYNALNVFRGRERIKIKPAAGDFAPRLDELHRTLDAAVCAAYGWDAAILDDEESLLGALLALNLARAESE